MAYNAVVYGLYLTVLQKAYVDVPLESQQCVELLSKQETLSSWLDANIPIKSDLET